MQDYKERLLPQDIDFKKEYERIIQSQIYFLIFYTLPSDYLICHYRVRHCKPLMSVQDFTHLHLTNMNKHVQLAELEFYKMSNSEDLITPGINKFLSTFKGIIMTVIYNCGNKLQLHYFIRPIFTVNLDDPYKFCRKHWPRIQTFMGLDETMTTLEKDTIKILNSIKLFAPLLPELVNIIGQYCLLIDFQDHHTSDLPSCIYFTIAM
jgi:hypothetical protein